MQQHLAQRQQLHSAPESQHRCMSQVLQVCLPWQMQDLLPSRKMVPRTQRQGTGASLTRSVESAIMAPSLKTASRTISSVGKYLHPIHPLRQHAACNFSHSIRRSGYAQNTSVHMEGQLGHIPKLGRGKQAHQL